MKSKYSIGFLSCCACLIIAMTFAYQFSYQKVNKEIIFQERRYQEKPIFQGLQKLWNAVRCAGIYIECNTYAAGMQQRY